MKRAMWMGMVTVGILAAGCGKEKESGPRQPAIGPAGPGPAQAPQESTADAPDKTGFDSTARDSLQRVLQDSLSLPTAPDSARDTVAPRDTARTAPGR